MSRQNSFLGRLPPRARQILTLGGAAAAVLGVVYLGVSSQEQVHRQSSDNVIKNVLTDKNTREMTIDSMAAEMRRLVKENAGLRREIEVLKDEVDRKDYNAGIKIDPQVLRSQLNALTPDRRSRSAVLRETVHGSRYSAGIISLRMKDCSICRNLLTDRLHRRLRSLVKLCLPRFMRAQILRTARRQPALNRRSSRFFQWLPRRKKRRYSPADRLTKSPPGSIFRPER